MTRAILLALLACGAIAEAKKPVAASACGTASDLAELARVLSLKGNDTAALPLLEKSCDQPNGSGCYELATIFNVGKNGVAPNEARAAELFARAAKLLPSECQSGCQRDCVTLGWMLHTAQAVAHDGARSIALLTKACESSVGQGCFLLGTMYSFAYEVAKDRARAVALYRRACELDDPLGCNGYAYALERGDGVPLDRAGATRWYRRSCELGLKASCDKLAGR
jgi:TPR repeat protein